MNEPAYKPEQWVIYKQDAVGGFGQIVGAQFDSEVWTYSVRGVSLDTTYVSIREDEITHFNENGSWLEPQHAGTGNGSVYTEQS